MEFSTVFITALAVVSAARGECPEVVSKEDWQASPVTVVQNMTVPVPYVLIHHTHSPPACNTSDRCSAAMRSMQNYHQGKGWNDIGYNFVIGGNNRVYQGRGWDVVGAHSPKYNFMSIGISFIGDYSTELPGEDMMATARALIECGIERGSISADYKLLGHRQVRGTECPGGALYEHIKTWPHWDPMIDIVPRQSSTTPSTANSTNVVQQESTTPSTDNSTQVNIVNVELISGQCPEVVSKEEWQAGPVTIVENMTVPVPYVVIHHTYIPAACNTSDTCSTSMRSMQRYHQSKGWNDIGYNFVIGGNNRVYQGRGWDVVGAHSPKYNFMSIGISFIGDYRTELPGEDMMATARSLIECGIERGSISADYKLLGHRQVRATECPGRALYEQIQTWPHWDPMIDIVPRQSSTTPSTSNSTNEVKQESTTPSTANSTQVNIVNAGQCPEVVSKEEWQAGPVTIVENMTVPVPYVVIHHTYIPAACNTSDTCSASMRSMQRYHQSKGWSDIGYNFVIGGTNRVYQGRGWDVVGTHALKYNVMSIGIAFIGDYRTELPGEDMMATARALIECGIERGSISADYKLLGHRQVRATECPGEALYAHIQTWPHWDPMIDIESRESSTTPSSANSTQVNIVNAEMNTVNTGHQ